MYHDHCGWAALITFSKRRFTLDAVSQLDRDTSAALATIREWRNSLVPINRLPLEVLSLIPTHLSHEVDLFRATSVCRHWRRTFIQHGALWSQLNLTIKRSDLFVKTFLERAKESALDVRSDRLDHANILAMLSPHAQRFRTLDLAYNSWSDIQRFSEAAPGPLPLLRTLNINVLGFGMLGPETMNPPSPPLFSGAVNLKNFILHSEGVPYLNRFVYPNLKTFELSAMPINAEFHVSQLLNFLEASPTLETVHIRIEAEILLGDVPPGRVVVLPNIKIFSVTQDEPGYGIITHISCPSPGLMSLLREQYFEDRMPQEVFPTSVSWNAIGPQYVASTVDEVALEITTAAEIILSCSLSFSSPGPATLELGYRMIAGERLNDTPHSLGEKHSQVFSQASKAIREHPLLRNVKRLRIRDRHDFLTPHQLAGIAEAAARLFKFVGPLEELILDVDDLRPFLSPFFVPPEFQVFPQPDAFSLIKGLTIAEPSERPLNEECVAAIVGFVKSQHTRGVPFERASLHMKSPPVGMAERLEPWVGTLHFDGIFEVDDQLDLM